MKKFRWCLFVIYILTNSLQLTAQQKLKEGKATFEFSYPDEKGIEPDLLDVAETKQLIVYFRNGMTRVDQKSSIESISELIDQKKKDRIMLNHKDSLAITETIQENWENQSMMYGDTAAVITNDAKLIAGYKCRKAIVSYKVWEKADRQIEIWFTDEIAASNYRFSFKGISGFIMEYSYTDILYPVREGADFRTKMTCTKVEGTQVNEQLLQIPPGYVVTTMKELRKNTKVEYH